jgi:hypothetical protein
MSGYETLLFIGCLAAAAAFGGLLISCRTALLGLNSLNLFMVGSAMLSGFFVTVISGQSLGWLAEEQSRVVSYGIFGVIAMIGGLYFAWAPLRGPHPSVNLEAIAHHLNERSGWITFWVGTLFELLYPFVATIPTVSTAVSCLSSLERIGLFILLWSALHNGRWQRFIVALSVFFAISIVMSFATGFSFLRVNALLPMLIIGLFHRGVTWKSLVTLPVAILALITAMSAWLETRSIIRSGSLEGLPWSDKLAAFFGEYFFALFSFDPDNLVLAVFDRVDMTAILAEQVAYQPELEPYAYGDTMFSSFYTLIPRAVWPDKPDVAGGSEFVARFTGMWRPIDDETSIGLPYPFELYANGGPWLVIAGLALIGYIAGRMELRLFRRPAGLGQFWALATATAVICDGGQRTDVVLPALVASVLCAYALGWFIEKRSPEFVAGAMGTSSA